jgi:maltose alpha-D-glucosyltransferase/alpha-amylase
MAQHWYKSALLYCLDVKTFADGNGDGIGDFVGLTRKLPYLAALNIDCVWLQPFFASPLRDNGYDITDYYSVDPRLGSLGDFVEFSRAARDAGLRVMMDLVVNHTSIDHPWFQAARRDRESPFRDYYVWSDEEPPDALQGMVFPGEQVRTWTWDREARAYYFHRFYDHQPELNIANPAVRREIEKITGFWLALGVTGFRIDALPFLIELTQVPGMEDVDPHDYLRDLRHHVQTLCGDVCLMAEANLPPEEVPDYFGDGDKIHMSFNFWLNQHQFLALATGDAGAIRQAWEQLPPLPVQCQWNNFLRSHDELDLGRLDEAQRRQVFEAFGPAADMQLYGRGLRRRLAPMLDNDRRRLELAHSLMLSLPGTPVLRYGDEIGMGDDLSLPMRESVRTPMQWNDQANGGFSRAAPDRLWLPVIAQGEYGFPTVNVEQQRQDPDSLLNWLERLIRRRKDWPAFGLGDCTFLDTEAPSLLAHRIDHEDETVFAVHNLGDAPLTWRLPVEPAPAAGACLHDLLSGERLPLEHDGHFAITLPPYGYRWFGQRDAERGR